MSCPVPIATQWAEVYTDWIELDPAQPSNATQNPSSKTELDPIQDEGSDFVGGKILLRRIGPLFSCCCYRRLGLPFVVVV